MKKIKILFNKLGICISVFFTVISSLLVLSVRWMFQTWNNLTMDELMFHLSAPLEGTNEGMIHEYLLMCVLPAVETAVLVIIFIYFF